MKKSKSSIEWNKVTPLSKYLAMALFVALPFVGFTFGMRYQQTLESSQNIIDIQPKTPITSLLSAALFSSKQLRTYNDLERKLSFQYPENLNFYIDEQANVHFYQSNKDNIIFTFYRFDKIPISEFDFTTIEPKEYLDKIGRKWVTSIYKSEKYDYSAVNRQGNFYYVVNFLTSDLRQTDESVRSFFNQIVSTLVF